MFYQSTYAHIEYWTIDPERENGGVNLFLSVFFFNINIAPANNLFRSGGIAYDLRVYHDFYLLFMQFQGHLKKN